MTDRGALRLAGTFGLAWGVLAMASYIAEFALAGRIAPGGAPLGLVLAALATAAFAATMFFLAPTFRQPMGKIACYAGMALALVLLLLQFVRIGGNALAPVVSVLLGIAMIAAGALAAMQVGSGAWKGFAILLIVAGAMKAIVVGEIVYPFIACAAGIVLFVAMKVAAKRAA